MSNPMIERLENRALLSATVTQTFKIDSALSFATGSGVITLPTAVDANGKPIGAEPDGPDRGLCAEVKPPVSCRRLA